MTRNRVRMTRLVLARYTAVPLVLEPSTLLRTGFLEKAFSCMTHMTFGFKTSPIYPYVLYQGHRSACTIQVTNWDVLII